MPTYILRPMFSGVEAGESLDLNAKDEREAIVLAMVHAGPYGSELWQGDRLIGFADHLGNYISAVEVPISRSKLN